MASFVPTFEKESNQQEFEQRLLMEALPFEPRVGGIAVKKTVVFTVGTTTSIQLDQWIITCGRVAVFKDLEVTANTDCIMEIVINKAFTTAKTYTRRFGVKAYMSPAINFGNIFIEHTDTVTLNLIDVVGTGAVSVVVAYGHPQGFDITSDFNYSADKKILVISDSNGYGANAGNVGTYQTDDWWPFKVRDNYRNKGINTRLVNYSVHGIQTYIMDHKRSNGQFDSTKWDLIIYMLGTNDTVEGRDATNIANFYIITTGVYDAVISWKQTKQPKAKMLMLGILPLESVSRNTVQAEPLRAYLGNKVAAVADPNIKFLNLGDKFTATTHANYTDVSSGLHPTIAIWNSNITPAILTALNSNFPTI